MLLGDLFDLHAAETADHDDRLARGPVDRDRRVGFFCNREPLFDEQRVHRLALGVLPVRRHRRRHYFLRGGAALRCAGRHLDFAGLAATAHQDLRFDDPLPGRLLEEFRNGLRRKRVAAPGHGNAGPLEKLLALVLHQVHSGPGGSPTLKLGPCGELSQ